MTNPTSTPKRVLVTGVSGQDGSYMADYLLANTNHFVFGMVRRTAKPDYRNMESAMKHPRFKLVTGDLSDSTSIDNVVKEVMPDYFINLAAQSFVGVSWKIPETTFDVDAIGVIRCLEAIRKHVPHCRFYQAGSSEEFGKVQYSPQDEKHPPCPQSVYGAAKCAARQIVRVYRESYGLYAVQGHLFNHESERRGEEFVTRKISLGVARIARAIKDGKPFEPIELGNLDAKRDWSHAEDFVDGIWRMLNQEQYTKWPAIGHLTEVAASQFASKRIDEYVLASGETHAIRTFVEKAFLAANLPGSWSGEGVGETYHSIYGYTPNGTIKLVRINPAFYRPAEVELLLGDATRAKAELGWSPKVSFDDLVIRMVQNDLKEVGL